MRACKKHGSYKGLRMPTCSGGHGCDACWETYHRAERSRIFQRAREGRTSDPDANLRRAYWSGFGGW